jgi:hypothetical protein
MFGCYLMWRSEEKPWSKAVSQGCATQKELALTVNTCMGLSTNELDSSEWFIYLQHENAHQPITKTGILPYKNTSKYWQICFILPFQGSAGCRCGAKCS